MYFIPGHYYLVRLLTTPGQKETIAKFDGECWFVIGDEVEVPTEHIDPICEVVRADKEDINYANQLG